MKVNELYKVSVKPEIWLGIGSKHWNELQGTADKPVYLLSHPMWHFGLKSAWLYRKLHNMLAKKHVKLIMLMNTTAEQRLGKWAGLDSHFINQNIHVCEHKFHVAHNGSRKHEAVYIAAAQPYKRLQLAKNIKNLFVITYFWPDVRNDKGEWDLHAFEPSIAHADFNRHRIGQEEINRILNDSVCGLALSKKEGAMLASLEYQLSGLPVVTTRSLGGRDVFLDPRHTVWVRDDAASVAEGVRQMVKAQHDPALIRKHTLENLEVHRRKFYDLVCRIFSESGETVPAYEAFHKHIWGPPLGVGAIATRYKS